MLQVCKPCSGDAKSSFAKVLSGWTSIDDVVRDVECENDAKVFEHPFLMGDAFFIGDADDDDDNLTQMFDVDDVALVPFLFLSDGEADAALNDGDGKQSVRSEVTLTSAFTWNQFDALTPSSSLQLRSLGLLKRLLGYKLLQPFVCEATVQDWYVDICSLYPYNSAFFGKAGLNLALATSRNGQKTLETCLKLPE